MNTTQSVSVRSWTLVAVQACALVTIASFCWHLSGFGFAQLKSIVLFSSVTGALSAVASYWSARNTANPQARENSIARSHRQIEEGIPWYAAPVLWVPLVMLVAIWYFRF